MTGLLCTALHKVPAELDEVSWFDVQDLVSYWETYPPLHVVGRHFAQHFGLYSVPVDAKPQYSSQFELEAFAAQLG